MKDVFLRTVTLKIAVGDKFSYGLRGNVVRVISATTAGTRVNFETAGGSSEFFLEVGEEALFDENDFLNIEISHNAVTEQTIVLAVGSGARIGSAKISGAVTITGGYVELGAATLAALEGVDLNPETLNALRYEAYGASHRSITNLAANTPETVFTAAANVNGVIIHSAQFAFYSSAGGFPQSAFLAKATAPANVTDGDAILSADGLSFYTSTNAVFGSLKNAIKIPAGKGLYFIGNIAEAGASRSVLYTLL